MNNKITKESNNNDIIRSNPSQIFCKIGVIRNFTKFTRSVTFDKVAG